ncbi:general substrate transporter [Helicostylum pulchrum]|nr:general substrate transporter [Helicostylum pulchrum]
MVFCVIISSLGFFCNGWVIGSANLPGKMTHACETEDLQISTIFPDCLPMNEALWGFAVASFCIGGLMASLSGGYIQNRYGRKYVICYNSLGYVFGAVLISCATSTAMFIVGRIMCGYSCGLGSLAIPIYIGEISTIKARGTMGAFTQGMITLGILISSVTGLPLSTVPLWRANYALVAVPAFLQLVTMHFCVESPRFLISKHQIEAAKINLQRLRSGASIDIEFYNMVEGQLGSEIAMFVTHRSSSSTDKLNFDDLTLVPQQKQVTKADAMNLIEIFRDPFIRSIAVIVIIVHMLQQLIGINAVMYYSTSMFEVVFPSGDMSKYMSIVTVSLNFVATVISILVIDRMGRRTLILFSITGATIFLVQLVVGYVYQVDALLIVSVLGYVCSFAVGMGPIPWIIIAELTPVPASASVGAIATSLNWTMNFLVGQCFPVLFSKMQGYAFIIFCLFGFIYAAFVYIWLPETKGKSFEDITMELKKRRL